ncbi:MAG: HPF/RaiA family ribosome-associated protein [Deltaproteobacteria bacterium]|nr:HPF/RaiA family ribosome-associated protein [Deltaproteobacteria bacterium]
MKMPLEISSRKVELSQEIRDLIQEKSEKLDHLYDDIVRCRVIIDMPHRSQRSGTFYEVRLDLTVPGGEVIVRQEPGEDLYVAIFNSFEVAQRRLKDYAGKRRGEVKLHTEKPIAQVAKIFHDEGYGFLVTPDGREIYFHENALLNGKFKDLEMGRAVQFVEREGDEGPQASSITLL